MSRFNPFLILSAILLVAAPGCTDGGKETDDTDRPVDTDDPVGSGKGTIYADATINGVSVDCQVTIDETIKGPSGAEYDVDVGNHTVRFGDDDNVGITESGLPLHQEGDGTLWFTAQMTAKVTEDATVDTIGTLNRYIEGQYTCAVREDEDAVYTDTVYYEDDQTLYLPGIAMVVMSGDTFDYSDEFIDVIGYFVDVELIYADIHYDDGYVEEMDCWPGDENDNPFF